MSRLSILFLTFFASLFVAFASPIAYNTNATELLEKRVTHTGRGTWFDVGLGACGKWNVNSDHIVAISSAIYGSGGNCEQYVRVTNTANGKSAWGLTRDECPSCAAGSLDMSPSLFSSIGNLDTGVLSISWHFEKKGFQPPS